MEEKEVGMKLSTDGWRLPLREYPRPQLPTTPSSLSPFGSRTKKDYLSLLVRVILQ